MTGARHVHDTLERLGFDVLIADAQKTKGLAPLACKRDRIDARVLAVLSERCLVPEIWLPDPAVRAERELARFGLHLVKHRSMLKQRIHSTLINFGQPCPVSDLFGLAGRELLQRLELPPEWRQSVDVSVHLIDELDLEIADVAKAVRTTGADHPYVPLLQTGPGIGWVLASRSPPRSATSRGSRTRASCRAIPASARRSCSRAAPTAAARPASTARATCAGRCSRDDARAQAPGLCERYQQTKRRLGKSAAPRSPRSRSPVA
jgi:hypothetical protein